MYVDRRARYADSAALAFSASLPLEGPWLTTVSYIIAHTEPRFQRFTCTDAILFVRL